jgi:glycosyltransferase involved in cell wall biosynthesis
MSALARAAGSSRKEKIRISFVIDSLSRAGTESQLLALIRLLNRDRFEPTLVLLDGSSELSQSLEPVDCPILRLGATKLLSRRTFGAARKLKRFWRTHRPDIVQAYFLDSAYFAVPLAKLADVRKIVRVRNNLGYWLTRKHRILNRLLRPFVDVTLTNCESGREALIAEGLAPSRVVALENGVDLKASRDRQGAERYTVGCVANLRPVKNVDGLLRAAAIIHAQRPNVRFAVAGDGPERTNLESLRDSLGLRDRFHFLGSLADVPAFLDSVRIAVLPSHSEGMSNSLLEAMAAGKAIVATNVGANARVLGDAGVIIPPRDDATLAAALRNLIDDPARVANLGRAAQLRVEAHFSREKMVERFENFYFELAN